MNRTIAVRSAECCVKPLEKAACSCAYENLLDAIGKKWAVVILNLLQRHGRLGLGTENAAILFKWTPTDSLSFDLRMNRMRIDRPFGGADGAGLVVLNEEGAPTRT